MTNTITGIVLAAAAGLNAYIPLLGLALADRALSSVTLARPYDVLSSTGGIVVLLILLTIEIIVDKIPRLDHINDFINSAIRPASGALCLMAVTSGTGEIKAVFAMLIGLFIAGAVHAYKAISRVKITTLTNGVGNPLVSTVEDFIASSLTLLAVTLPWLGLISIPLFGLGLAWFYRTVPKSMFGQSGQSLTASVVASKAKPAIVDPAPIDQDS